jgi:hypothetical protein
LGASEKRERNFPRIVFRQKMANSLLVSAVAYSYVGVPPPTDFYERAKLRVDLKAALVRLGASSGRGQFFSTAECAKACEYVAQLESVGLPALPSDLTGTWDLVLTDVEPFRASPFWWALGSALDAFKPGAAKRIFPAHRLATSVGEVGRVRQTIDLVSVDPSVAATGWLTSEVGIKAGVLPGLPLAFSGDVVTTAEVQLLGDETGAVGALSAKLLDTVVRRSTLLYGYVALGGTTSRGELSLGRLFDDRALPVGNMLRSVRGGGDADVAKRPLLRTSYLDEELRVSRTPDEHFFVFVRADDSGVLRRERSSRSSLQSTPPGAVPESRRVSSSGMAQTLELDDYPQGYFDEELYQEGQSDWFEEDM